MKILNYGNLAIVFALIISLILSQFNPYFKGTAFLLGLFIMPAYQLLVGIIWFSISNYDKNITTYFKAVLIYFVTVFCLNGILKWEYIKILAPFFGFLFWAVPITLALYFTYILNQHSNK